MKSTPATKPAAQDQAKALSATAHERRTDRVNQQHSGSGRRNGLLAAQHASGTTSRYRTPRVARQRQQLQAAFGQAIQARTGPKQEQLLQGKFQTTSVTQTAEVTRRRQGQRVMRSAQPRTQPKSVTTPIQRQVASGIASKASLTAVNWSAFLRTSRLNSYMKRNEPTVSAGRGKDKDTFELVWPRAVQFNDGTTGDLHMHMHEGVLDPDTLAGGGAWVDGGAVGHGQNIDGILRLRQTCVSWINEAYGNGYDT